MRENQIYTSSKYDDFVFREANRNVDESHVSKIAENMEKNGWQGAPIEVSESKNGKLQIEDGQHRYAAAKKTGTPIRFIVVKEKSVYDVAKQNSLSKTWGNIDYVHAYASEGSYSYKKLENLKNEFPDISLSDIMKMLTDGRVKREELKKGYIRITDEQYFQAREHLKSIATMNESLKNIRIKTKSPYIRALIILLRNGLIEAQRMIDKIDSYGRMLLMDTVSEAQAYVELEKLYNYHQQKNIVYFGDAIKRIKK